MSAKTEQVIDEVRKVIHGKDNIIRMVLAAILAKGHVLLEDIPGVGKTTMAMAFAKAMSMDYRRVQFTPDVLPGDISGFNMYDKVTGSFKYQEGMAFTNLFLADEINRTSPKTQSALLEVMEEQRVTVEGVSRELPKPFFVIATENPFGSSGTQKLPESQLDRFMVCLSIGYPDAENAALILKGNSAKDIQNVVPVLTKEELTALQEKVEEVYVDDALYDYIVEITESTRKPSTYELGLSPRGSIALLRMAKAYAFLEGRSYLLPDDIKEIYLPVSLHRVKLSQRAKAAGTDLSESLLSSLSSVVVPKISGQANAKG